jgi:predicted kinase
MDPALILVSGLPGCGKTTLARRVAGTLRAPLFAKDRVQRVLRDHVPGAAPLDGYRLLLDLADEQLALGLSVVLDAVFPLDGFRAAAREIAAHHDAAFRPVYCFCSDEAVWRARMDARVQYVPGWDPVGWDEVERLRPLYQPWAPGAALFVDAVQSIDENLQHVLRYLAPDAALPHP